MNKLIKIELPAYWASVLVNGDVSSDAATLEAETWISRNLTLRVMSCNDESYIGRYNGLMCDMLTYEADAIE